VLADGVVAVAVDRGGLLLDPVEAVNLAHPRKPYGPCAQHPHRLVRHQRLLHPDGQAGIVGGSNQRLGNAQRLSHRAGQHPQPDQPDRLKPSQHLPNKWALEDALLDGVAVDQQRRVQRTQAHDTDRVPGAAAGRAEIDLASPNVIDQPCLVLRLAHTPPVLHLDADRPTGQTRDLVDKRVELARVASRVRHREDARLLPARPAGLVGVGAGATTAGKHHKNKGQADKSSESAGRSHGVASPFA
jgi:hypothetical protein